MKMMNRLLLSVAAACGATIAANAADLAQPRVFNYPAPAVDPGTTGWYLRGDVGVGILGYSQIDNSYIDAPNAGQTAGYLNHTNGDTTFVDVGVGYQFTDNLRGDVTLQYRAAAAIQGANYITNTTSNLTGENEIIGSTSSVVGLVNGYYDVTHWNGLTPYVGAGVGVAYNEFHAVSNQQGGFANSPTAYPEYGTYSSKWTPSFAWALHSGLSYDINQRLKLEVGYSFLDTGTTKTAGGVCQGGGLATLCGDTYKIKNLYSSDIHIGMRWLFDAGTSSSGSYQSTSYQPSFNDPRASSTAPVVAKY